MPYSNQDLLKMKEQQEMVIKDKGLFTFDIGLEIEFTAISA